MKDFMQDLGSLLLKLLKVLFDTIARWIIVPTYKDVEGEVCLITGAGSGIGRLLALHFAERKARLVLWGRKRKGLEETAKMAQQLGATAFADVCDVSSREQIKEAAERARNVVGDVTILVNNAGLIHCKELLNLTDEEIRQTMDVNTMAHFWTVREFLPYMLKRNHGHVVTISSSGGLIPTHSMPDYCASKHAAVGFHQSLYLDLQNIEGNNVKTTLVCPYLIKTGLLTGVDIKRSWIIPALEPEECVHSIMHAVLTNRPVVATPKLLYLFHGAITWLPMEAQVALYEFLGGNTAPKSFMQTRSN